MEKITMNLQPFADLVWRYRDELSGVWPTPPPDHCLAFAVTEAGEAVDAWLRTFPEYARNNHRDHDELDEWADCLLMLISSIPQDSDIWVNVPYLGILSREETAELVVAAWRNGGYWHHMRHAIAAVIARIGSQATALKRLEARLERIKAKHGAAARHVGVKVFDYEGDDA